MKVGPADPEALLEAFSGSRPVSFPGKEVCENFSGETAEYTGAGNQTDVTVQMGH